MQVSTLKGLGLGFFATSCWASFYIVSRYFFGTDDSGLDPLWGSFLRYVLASTLLIVILLVQKQGKPLLNALKADWRLWFILGGIGIAAEGTLLFYSMKYTTAARSNLLTNISPIVTAVMSWFITREVFAKRQIVGMLLGFAGICGIFFLRGGDDFSIGGAQVLVGDLMAMAAGVCWSLYTVMGERITQKYGPQIAVCSSFIFGAIFMIPVLVIADAPITFNITAKGWGVILYLGLIANALANVCWYAALKFLKPGQLGAFGYVSVSLTVILSIICLGEKISTAFIGCLAVILLGTGMMLKAKKSGSKTEK